MFRWSGLTATWRTPPLLVFGVTTVGAFSELWNPDYYVFQPAFWSAHIIVLVPTLYYLWRLRTDYHTANGIPIPKAYRIATLVFYWLYMAYWAYFCWVAFDKHRDDPWSLHVAHAFMSFVWYIFFAVSSAVYYYTATLLLQRTAALRRHIADITETTTKEVFFKVYDEEYEKNRRIGNRWNIIIFLVILVLSLNIPADLLTVVIGKSTVALPGVIIKCLGLTWYLMCICKLNHMETYIQNHLHKHHVLQDDYEEIMRYMEVRRLGLNFFGVRINYELLTKIALFLFNIALPTLYGLISNHILKI